MRTTFRKWLGATLTVSLMTVGVTLAESPSGRALSPSEMVGTRGKNPGRGTFTGTCNQYQLVRAVAGNWSCSGDPDDTPCDNCETTSDITYADQGGDMPRNMKDGAAQDGGRQTKVATAKCVGQVCVGNDWSNFLTCSDPGTPKNQTP
jgi:hypothetical protein